MDDKNEETINEKNKSDSNTLKTNENEFHSIHKNLLINLKQDLGQHFQQNKMWKRVAKLEKIGNKINNKCISKFNREFKGIIDFSVNETKKEIEENESLNDNIEESDQIIVELLENIISKQRETAKLNESIEKKSLHLKGIAFEENRVKRTIEVIDEENLLLAKLKDQIMNNFKDFKQNIEK